MLNIKHTFLLFTIIFGTFSAVVNEVPADATDDQTLPQAQNSESDETGLILGDVTQPTAQNLDTVTQVGLVKPCIYLCIIGYKCENGVCVPDTKVNKCAVIRCRSGYRCVNGRCIKNPRPIPIPRVPLPVEYQTQN